MPNPIGRALRHRRNGPETLAVARAELQPADGSDAEPFALTSPAFAHGGTVPSAFRGRLFAPNVSPALAWAGVPAGAVELVLVVEDPDAPSLRTPAHLVVAGIDPALGGLAENAVSTAAAKPGSASALRFGRGVAGRRGWVGPMPVPSHGPHLYAFQLFAVDAPLTLADDFGLDDLAAAAAGHVLGVAQLDGYYENP
ncbi:YbhB/YbcL family Raf kinase inhibitor-like protein [Schumannella luteola]|uniref:YbhB/YbcL family Raf kinase inhibitor-like protein n=1 Tax=Schumannella luteola TaxID=472059 RepID=A0A852YAW5_9MICO|nr:YbhB/YbcL family Raf kinase inhibitor-like protein [Schumannella luteola]NYG98500.1 hypothetical protein [Schumannella luteola]TPX01276.1 YbhB/YbcL family Raf kinase inhibitor-like protein [Schumannella luteola]